MVCCNIFNTQAKAVPFVHEMELWCCRVTTCLHNREVISSLLHFQSFKLGCMLCGDKEEAQRDWNETLEEGEQKANACICRIPTSGIGKYYPKKAIEISTLFAMHGFWHKKKWTKYHEYYFQKAVLCTSKLWYESGHFIMVQTFNFVSIFYF